MGQGNVTPIKAAIATGARRVRFQTHEVEYQSIGDMLKVRDLIKANLDATRAPGVLFTQYEGGH
jgi:hypothetical protein